MKIGSIEMDDRIIKALRDDKLVIFAGAGVSMGPPSSLPSFEELAIDIARGTGYEAKPPWDQLFGSLQCKGVSIHEIASKYLSSSKSSPNDLHRNLLFLFRSLDRVRLITTNFDYHFESGAKEIFNGLPALYQAPALPLGRDFYGIVHVHGALDRPKDMVLSDADFGRAYLTEGWARRFLVEVFHHYTVLFVGYSYSDIVMRYLARALPTSNEINRFVLTNEFNDSTISDGWTNLGIIPISFNLAENENKFFELYDCIDKLARRSSRGVLDWQNRINEICKSIPPTDEESIGEIEQALDEVYTTRFFANVARDVQWPKWLSDRKYLEALFKDNLLSEPEKILANWLVENYMIEHAYEIYDLFAQKDIHINPEFWILLVRKLANTKEIETDILGRWVTIILEGAPLRINYMMLVRLAEKCSEKNMVYLALKIFLFCSRQQLSIKKSVMLSESGRHFDVECELLSNHWELETIWTECLKPHITFIAQPLLSGIVSRIEDIFSNLMAWGKANRDWDMCSLLRAAVEKNKQDKYPRALDVLIDAARDTLEWISESSPLLLDSWNEQLIISDVPILRRISIYILTLHPVKTCDEKLIWLQEKVDLNSNAEHHEIFRALELNYPMASPEIRKQIVDTILTYKKPAIENMSEEERTSRTHFDLLSWLVNAKPDCQYAIEALSPIIIKYPKWKLREHSDFNFWIGPIRGSTSPWTIEQLLAMNLQEKLDELLSYKGDFFDGPGREGLLSNIEKACKQNISWALSFLEILVEKGIWDSDIWPSIIRGLQESELSEQDYTSALKAIARPELYTTNAFSIAYFIYSLVYDEGKPYALSLLEDANKVALEMWEIQDDEEIISDWLQSAINRTDGKLVEFWLHSLSLLTQHKSKTERTIPDNYKELFNKIIYDPTTKGGIGRCLLCSQTSFLYGLDEVWVRENLLILYGDDNVDLFLQAWHGFLSWGNFNYHSLAEEMLAAFTHAVTRLNEFLPDYRDRFVEFYTYLTVFITDDPIEKFLPDFFSNSELHDRVQFATHIGHMLRQMDVETKKQVWNRWLKKYWEKRLLKVLAPLEAEEILEMLEWLLSLEDLFDDAVSLAILMPTIEIEPSYFLFELRDSDLISRFQAKCAELLIYLCKCVNSYLKEDLSIIAESLKDIPTDLSRRLKESLLLIGMK